MYGTITGFSYEAGANILSGIPAQAHKQGSEKNKEVTPQTGKPTNDFLNTVFKPIHIADYEPLYDKENYNYLYDSAKNYARLLKKDFNLPKEYRNFLKLYETFRDLLPENNRLELVQDGNYLSFQVIDDREEGLLYMIPCEIIDSAQGELREIYICFFCLLRQTQGLSSLLEENCCFDMMTMELPERELTEEDDEWMHLLADYNDGDINKALKLVDEAPKYTIRALQNKIKKYRAQHEKKWKMLEKMLEGLKLFSKKKRIVNYAFFPKEDEEYHDTYYAVPIDRIIQIVYSTSDQFFENLFQWTCEEANQGGYDILSGGDMLITPDTKITVTPDEYVINFLKWLNEFCYELND